MRPENAPAIEAPGIPGDALRELIATLEDQGLDPHALVITQRGAEGWTDAVTVAWEPYGTEQPALVYSVSKTFTSLAIGMLEADGLLSLDDSVGDLLGLPNPHGLTVRHLLTMNTGHDPAQIDALGFDVRALLTVPPVATPGTHFAYNSDATYALSCIVTALTGQRLTDYLRPRLLDPLGIGRRWMMPARGVEQGFSGFHLTVGDIARVSTMLADGGRIDGRQLVPSRYVDDLSRAWSDTRDHAQPADEGDWARGYGYQVWRSTHGFRLDGAYGQFGLVMPERGLVIAYQGSTTDTQSTLTAMWRLVDAIGNASGVGSRAASDREDAAGVGGAPLDSWNARGAFTPDPNGVVPTAGWALTETGDGWTLAVPEVGDIAVAGEGWARTVLPLGAPRDDGGAVVVSPPVEAGTHVLVAGRGERRSEGILAHLVVPTSPHRMIVEAAPGGAVRARWHTVPLQGPSLSTLSVPEWVIRR